MCGCGRENWCAGACAAHYQNVCNVRAGAAENPRTLKVWHFAKTAVWLVLPMKAALIRI